MSRDGTQALIRALGYSESLAFLQGERMNAHFGYAHVFRRARQTCHLQGVYALQDAGSGNLAPLVYVCKADKKEEASKIHRRVWNQNVAPFVVVSTPQKVLLYPGFRYRPKNADSEDEPLAVVNDVNNALDRLDGISASAIEDGRIWERWGRDVSPATRVDWVLLDELKDLGDWLRTEGRLDTHPAHALIGKYVYLHYLWHRRILSAEKLREWTIAPQTVFGHEATLAGLKEVVARLDEWLNGSVFPFDLEAKDGIENRHVAKVAGVFAGDEVTGQLSLDFRRYDFAEIPIETLSVVYQQFLHAEGRGRKLGAYYTPIPVVNLMLDELETRRTLERGVSVLDPACGSGAFLVQCYRRQIERERQRTTGKLRPSELRAMLTEQIFGMDQDSDACRVTELSLILTLLDYVEPPDLKRYPRFKLPELSGANILQGDFFRKEFPWADRRFDIVASNPPWKELNRKNSDPADRRAFAWMQEHKTRYPIGGYQLAEAFAWKVTEHTSAEGVVGLLMPAMSLSKTQSLEYRQEFFRRTRTWCVVNFANLAEVLFAGRSTVPAAAFFYRPGDAAGEREDAIVTFSPFLVNQVPLTGPRGRKGSEAWQLMVNGGEIQKLRLDDVATGKSRPWKLAMWGSVRDRRLLARIESRYPSFKEFANAHALKAHEGVQLRSASAQEAVELVEELVGKRRLRMKSLRRNIRRYGFPASALNRISAAQAYVRKGRVEAPLSVCRPPHVILHHARRFAVYTDEFIVVPPRQLGIAGRKGQEALLKALALYLVSEFATYHQLFSSAQMGIQKSIADRKDLDLLPIPLDAEGEDGLREWVWLYDELAACWHMIKDDSHIMSSAALAAQSQLQALEQRANELTYEALGLSQAERYLVRDLVHDKLQLLGCQVPQYYRHIF